MATENLQIPDIQASQNQKEVTANAAHNLLDRAINGRVSVAMSAGTNNMTNVQQRENFVMELTGTPDAPFVLEMFDTNQRTMAVVNNTNDVCTIKNPSAGGSGQPVIAVGEASIFHFDGTNFFDFTALALTVASWTGLTDTPSVYTGESGRYPQVNDAETALEFVGTAAKRNVIAATTGAIVLADDIETGDILDGVTLAEFDRVLVKNQAAGQENGIYYVQTAAPPIRVEDFDDALDMNESPVLVPVLEGTANAGTVWIHTTAGAITVDTTPLTFVNALSPGTFLTLTDTPANFTNAEGKEVRGNAAGNALEFAPKRWRDPVRVATAVSGTFASDFDNASVVDGITINTGDRILIKDQGDSDDGIYIVEASGAPTRVDDMDENTDIVELGAVVAVLLGDTNAHSTWMHTAGVDIGTDTLVFLKMEPTVGYMPLPLGTARELLTNEIAGPLDDTTDPRFERINGATDKGLRILWPTGSLLEVAFAEAYMPPDIDADKDLTIHLVAEMSGGTDETTSIDVQVFDSSGDAEMGGSTGNITSTRTEYTITITAANLTGHPLGWLSVSLVPAGAHAADTLQVSSAWIEYTRKVA